VPPCLNIPIRQRPGDDGLVGSWLAQVRAKTLYIESGSPWENGYCESFNGKLRDELLNGERLKEAQIAIPFIAGIATFPMGVQLVPFTPRSGRVDAIISHSRWYKKSVRPITTKFEER
jgi:transposase InsO family protein